jgi:DNA-binding NarL/FixJ family response regulator
VRCPVLVERDDELRALSQLAGDASAAGAARVAVITGEAGSGKSRLARELAASLPEQWSIQEVRLTRTAAGLPAVADARPLALMLDDAHFLDPAALARLPAPHAGAVLVLVTFRLGFHRAGSAEMRALAALVRDPAATELRLAPLSPAGVAAMAAAMGRYATEDLFRRTAGNPFWAEEVLGTGDRVPWTVVETVAAELAAAAPAARELAAALAVAEEPLPAAVAARLVDDLDGAWAALGAAGLAGDDAGMVGLRHALVAEAVLAGLGPAERAAWHRRLAEALAGEPVEPDRLARHSAAAGDPERAAALARAALPHLRAAGASRRAFECLRLATARPPEDPALYEEAALTAARLGEYDAMREWLASAERLYRAAGRADRAARMLLDPAFDYLPVRRSGTVREEPVERLLADAQLAVARGEPQTARALIDAALDAARARGDGMALARAARMVVIALGEFERGEALLDEAVEFADVAAQPGRLSRVLTIRGVSRIAQGYMSDALELGRQAVALSRQDPEAVLRTGQIALGNALLLAGEIDEGAALLVDAARAQPWGGPLLSIADGYRRFERGELKAGHEAITQDTDRLLAQFDFDPLGRAVTTSHVLIVRALAEVHGGRPTGALRTVRRIDAVAPEPYSDVAADLAYVLARAGAALGDRDALQQARRRIDDLTRVASGPGVLAAAEAVRAFAAGADEATRRFQTAAALFEQAPRAALAAELWCDAAQAAGAGAVATAALQRARRLCEEHGLARIAARAADLGAELAAAPTRLPAVLAELTEREREVVLLAAEGLSNREIGARLYLSEGTVRNYLSTAFGKLGVGRRTQLAQLVATAQATG